MMTRNAVWELCKSIVPPYGFEPILLLAICEQESVNPNNPLEYRDRAARLEEGFYLEYTEPENFPTTNEALFAISFGLTQMMGQSLHETGFFQWWFSRQTPLMQAFLDGPLGELAVTKAINEYMINPPWQIERGCMHLTAKRKLAAGNELMMLRYWNGDISGRKQYAEKVYGRRDKLAAIYQ